MKCYVFTWIVYCILISTALAADKVVLATLEWAPYVSSTLPQNGYVAEIAREAFAREGYDVEMVFNKWTRSVGLAKAGEVDGYLPEYYADDVAQFASFSRPFPGGPLGFFKMKKDDIEFRSLEDLIGYRIGVVKGYVNTVEFDTAEFLDKDSVAGDLMNFKKLVAGRVDLVVADKFVGNYIIQTAMPGEADNIEFMKKILGRKGLYICISRKSKRHDLLIDAVNRGLSAIDMDGSIKRIMREFNLPVE